MMHQVLLVDDEQGIRASFQRYLQEIGCFVTLAEEVNAALSLLRAFQYDLVITDIVMPNGSGLDILRQVRSQQNPCPVIMITGSPRVESAAEALRMGAFDYVTKPVHKGAILHVAGRALEFGRISRENERFRSDLQAIFSSVRDAIISVDENFRVVNFNAAAVTLCGIPCDAAGTPFHELPLHCGQGCRGALETAIRTGKPAETRYLKCRGGREEQEQYVSISVAPLQVESRQVRGAVLVVRDETSLYRLEKRQVPRASFAGIHGKSAAMQHLYSMIERLAAVPSTVLLLGENGTGKELVAAALHECGGAERPFVTVNCAALAETLLESELFGHVRGAFTGAVRDKAGLFEKADGGTLFLDEVGEISPAMQVKLLRVLQEREFEKVGGSTPIKVNVRVITATNKDLAREVEAKRFRQDLYYRLKVVELMVAPLRERCEDVPQLVEHFRLKLNARLSKNITGVSDEALRVLTSYHWPGNVRELEHALEHAFIMCSTRVIFPEHLPADLQAAVPCPDEVSPRDRIRQALEKTAGNKSKAARLLNMDRKTLYRKMHDLEMDGFESS